MPSKTKESKPKAIVVDLDGTLFNFTHRQHFLEQSPPNWAAFFAALEGDSLIQAVYELVLFYKHQGHKVIICTGRPRQLQAATERMLKKHNVPYDKLLMRPDAVRQKGHKLKHKLYRRYIDKYYQVALAFDDHPHIIDMWLAEGINCMALPNTVMLAKADKPLP